MKPAIYTRLAAAIAIASTMLLGAPVAAQAATTQARAPAAAACAGTSNDRLPVSGDITNSTATQGGHFYWSGSGTSPSICVGTVREWVRYTSSATKTWRVRIYDSAHPQGLVIAQKVFSLSPGDYYWDFAIHQSYSDPSKLCIGASNTSGYSCASFDEL